MLELLIFVGGLLIGIYGVVFGGAQFLAAPFFQVLFPEATVGQIVGNTKLGSLMRGVASSWATWHLINARQSLILALPFVLGSFLGARAIAALPPHWMVIAILFAILVCEAAPHIRWIAGRAAFVAAAFVAGIYGGIFGAGIALVIVALLRTQDGREDSIAAIKIDARFIELMVTSAAIVTHFVSGNLVTRLWLPWAAGSLVGGVIGGRALVVMTGLSARRQLFLLRTSYAVALLGAGWAIYAKS